MKRKNNIILFFTFLTILMTGEEGNLSAQVINGDITPAEGAKQIQDGLDKWYKPAQ